MGADIAAPSVRMFVGIKVAPDIAEELARLVKKATLPRCGIWCWSCAQRSRSYRVFVVSALGLSSSTSVPPTK
jgi:hypothetical protein